MIEFITNVYVMSEDEARTKSIDRTVYVVELNNCTHPLSETKRVFHAYTELRTVVIIYNNIQSLNLFFDTFFSRYARLPNHALIEARAIHDALIL